MSRIPRVRTRTVKIGSVAIGGGHPIAIQSMAKTRTADVEATVRQIRMLAACGCQIVRVAVKDRADAKAIRAIKNAVGIALVADIHFDFRLALAAIEYGADKIRLNPGNIYRKDQVRQVALAARQARIPIRVGLNSGSVGGSGDQVQAMVSKARGYLRLLEKAGFYDTVVSLKAQNAFDTIRAYRRMRTLCDYPFHLGVTATGSVREGLIKSSVAIGSLLLDGIGDTIRISLTDRPEEEVAAARLLLQSLGLCSYGPQIVSCPTCGRCQVDLIRIVKDLEQKLKSGRHAAGGSHPTVAVMGCVVNGPGEAKHADLGIAFGIKEGLLFKKGKPVRKVSAARAVSVLVEEIKKFNI